jgi:hypothetical protein
MERFEKKKEDLPIVAEKVCLEVLSEVPGILEARETTAAEDSGLRQITKDLAIDGVVYDAGDEETLPTSVKEHPTLAIQVTIASDSVVLNKKRQELLERPFIRLPEMQRDDVAIPRALIVLKPEDVRAYQADPNVMHHPEIRKVILKGLVANMQFMKTKTKNPREASHVDLLRKRFEDALLDIAA